MTTVRTPREVFDELLRTTIDGDWDGLLDLYAADVVIEMPFAPPGVPVISDGPTFHTRIKQMASARPWNFDAADVLRVHETADPEVIIAEFTFHGTVAATGAPLSLSYAMVITVRDGQIVHSRDYGNPLTTSAALGRLPELVAAFQAERVA
ncbi:MAG TPA: nuclear transport factor 2 family protein [Pseudonocardiaceae bacterium]|nr:nuclear transport factor 2 family protein [Pseudonocardiaceae bacterium]